MKLPFKTTVTAAGGTGYPQSAAAPAGGPGTGTAEQIALTLTSNPTVDGWEPDIFLCLVNPTTRTQVFDVYQWVESIDGSVAAWILLGSPSCATLTRNTQVTVHNKDEVIAEHKLSFYLRYRADGAAPNGPYSTLVGYSAVA